MQLPPIADGLCMGNAEVLVAGEISSRDDTELIERAIALYEVGESEDMLGFNNFHVKVIWFTLLGVREAEINPTSRLASMWSRRATDPSRSQVQGARRAQ
jgi:hypothetical protein